MTQPPYSNWRTVELMEMPRCFSISIQSEAVERWFLRAVTLPARLRAPPKRRNFSVSVVFPASGWEMMAKVRRRWISLERIIGKRGPGWRHGPGAGGARDGGPFFL